MEQVFGQRGGPEETSVAAEEEECSKKQRSHETKKENLEIESPQVTFAGTISMGAEAGLWFGP